MRQTSQRRRGVALGGSREAHGARQTVLRRTPHKTPSETLRVAGREQIAVNVPQTRVVGAQKVRRRRGTETRAQHRADPHRHSTRLRSVDRLDRPPDAASLLQFDVHAVHEILLGLVRDGTALPHPARSKQRRGREERREEDLKGGNVFCVVHAFVSKDEHSLGSKDGLELDPACSFGCIKVGLTDGAREGLLDHENVLRKRSQDLDVFLRHSCVPRRVGIDGPLCCRRDDALFQHMFQRRD